MEKTQESDVMTAWSVGWVRRQVKVGGGGRREEVVRESGKVVGPWGVGPGGSEAVEAGCQWV